MNIRKLGQLSYMFSRSNHKLNTFCKALMHSVSALLKAVVLIGTYTFLGLVFIIYLLICYRCYNFKESALPLTRL